LSALSRLHHPQQRQETRFSSLTFGENVDQLAMRGARYGFPSWVATDHRLRFGGWLRTVRPAGAVAKSPGASTKPPSRLAENGTEMATMATTDRSG